MIERHGKTAVRLASSAALLGLFLALLWATYGTGMHALMERAATFYAFAVKHAWLLVGLYVLRLPLFLPASLVIVLTGMICGPLQGELVAVAGLTLGGGIEFALVRASAASLLERWRAPGLLQQWRERIRRKPFHAILMMRLCFVPFDPVNIVAALAQAPLRAFLGATVLGVAPTSLPMVLSGASIDFQSWMASGRIWPGFSAIHWPYIAGSAAAAALIGWHASVRRRAQEPPQARTMLTPPER
jgi:uncharacterized membrane protein YdjX (TVP38/TMEM64 family)